MDIIKLGCHVSIADGLCGAAREAFAYGANAFMLYTGAPQNTFRKPVEKLKIEEGRKFMQEAGMSIENVVVHAPYVMNPANPDPEKREFAVKLIQSELKRTQAIGAPYFVLHPGNNKDREAGLRLTAESIKEALYPGQEPIICLETMAGKGGELCVRFEEIRAMLDMIGDDERMGVCFDTCHTFCAGYDIVNDFDGVMDEFDRIVGLERIKVVHVNGSLNPPGSGKDRHANIGAGPDNPKGADYIGFEAIYNIVRSKALEGRVFILETPWIDDKTNLYKEEIERLRGAGVEK